MRLLLLAFVLSATLGCKGQKKTEQYPSITLSPRIAAQDSNLSKLIPALYAFLSTKDTLLVNHPLWDSNEFSTMIYPYQDILQIEASKHGKYFYRPTLMEMIPDTTQRTFVLKIGFLGHRNNPDENQIKAIYNLFAHIGPDNQVKFSTVHGKRTRDWSVTQRGCITYRHPPGMELQELEAKRQLEDIELICELFQCAPIPITYYSCKSPADILYIRGFDYHPMMYVHNTGGQAAPGARVYSGNHSDFYTHEIVHVYTAKLYPNIPDFLDEGLATWIGGSGKMEYAWHRQKMQKLLRENPEFKFTDHLEIYDRQYYEHDTPISYMTTALVCEYITSHFGQAKLFSLFGVEGTYWDILKMVGLTPENLDDELKRQLNKEQVHWFSRY
jgi:hypothetical protein